MPHEEPAADYVIVRTVQLKQKRSSLGNGFKLVLLLGRQKLTLSGSCCQEPEKVIDGDGEEELHVFY